MLNNNNQIFQKINNHTNLEQVKDKIHFLMERKFRETPSKTEIHEIVLCHQRHKLQQYISKYFYL